MRKGMAVRGEQPGRREIEQAGQQIKNRKETVFDVLVMFGAVYIWRLDRSTVHVQNELIAVLMRA